MLTVVEGKRRHRNYTSNNRVPEKKFHWLKSRGNILFSNCNVYFVAVYVSHHRVQLPFPASSVHRFYFSHLPTDPMIGNHANSQLNLDVTVTSVYQVAINPFQPFSTQLARNTPWCPIEWRYFLFATPNFYSKPSRRQAGRDTYRHWRRIFVSELRIIQRII